MIKGLMFLKIGGEDKGLQYGMYSIKLLTEKRGISLNDLGDLFAGIDDDAIKGMDLIVDLIYSGMVNYNLVNGKNEDVNYYKIYNDFTSIDKADLPKIVEAFTATLNIDGADKSLNQMDKTPKDSKKK